MRSSALEEQQVLLAAEPSLHPPAMNKVLEANNLYVVKLWYNWFLKIYLWASEIRKNKLCKEMFILLGVVFNLSTWEAEVDL